MRVALEQAPPVESPSVLARAAQGDEEAFATVIGEHQSMVYSIALHFLRDGAAAEELAQEVFLQLHRNFRSIQSESHLVFWLRKVTSRRCIDHVRRERHRRHLSLHEIPEPSVLEQLQDPIASESLRRIVASLPDTQRMIVILRYQEDLDPAEIAEVLDMPVNTVKSHLQRALGMLRAKLERVRGEGK